MLKIKPSLSQKAHNFKRSKSPVREIMDYANPAYFKKLGFDPSEVISFAGGWVNHESPKELRESYLSIVKDNGLFHKSGGYSPTIGMPECRQGIVNYEKHLFDMPGLNVNQVAIGASSTQLTFNLLQVLLDPGDKILLLDPSYCNFPSQIITASDAKILRFPVIDTDSWTYIADERIDEFRSFILENKPKVILIVSPDNPTSQIPSDSFVQAALTAAEEIGSFLVVDFAYKELVFSEEYPDYFSWAPKDNFLSVHSNSKWCRGLGRRLGWIEAPEFIIASLESIQGSTILSPDTLHQMALTEYINNAIKEGSVKPYIRKTIEQYRKSAQQTISAIKEYLALPCFEPKGGLYTCIKVNMDGSKFVEKILKEAGVLFVPGWGFGRTLQNAVRVSCGPLVNDIEKIDIAMKRVGKILRK